MRRGAPVKGAARLLSLRAPPGTGDGAMAEGTAEPDAVALADACVNAARRIMTEFLAHRAGVPQGRA